MAIIEFDPQTHFAPENEQRIREWSPMLRAIEKREASLPTSRVVIKGASFVGPNENPKLLVVNARVFYKNPDGKEASYHVNFMPDAAALFVAFRVAADEVEAPAASAGRGQRLLHAIRKSLQPLTRRFAKPEYYAIAIRQPRWGVGTAKSFEIPAGLLDSTEKLDIESLKRGAAREFFEEALSSANKDLAEYFTSDRLTSLGNPISAHPAVTDLQHQFYLEIDIAKKAFTNLEKRLSGTKAGNAAEGELTQVEIMPLRKLHQSLVESGDSPWSAQAVSRYIQKRNLWKYIAG